MLDGERSLGVRIIYQKCGPNLQMNKSQFTSALKFCFYFHHISVVNNFLTSKKKNVFTIKAYHADDPTKELSEKEKKIPYSNLLRVNLRLSSLNFYFDLLLMTEIFIHIITLQYSLT